MKNESIKHSLLWGSLILNVILIVMFLLKNNNSNLYVVASPEQHQCLKVRNSEKIESVHKLYGPEYYNHYVLLEIDHSNEKSERGFKYNYSSCFYSSEANSYSLRELFTSYKIMQDSGNKNIGIFKDPYKDKIFLYGDR